MGRCWIVALSLLTGHSAAGAAPGPGARLRFESRCACPPLALQSCPPQRLSCPLRLWLGCGPRLFSRPQQLALTPNRLLIRGVDRHVRRLRREATDPITGLHSPTLLRLAGMQHELSVSISTQSERFAESLVNTYDRNQPTQGHFEVTYRRALFPRARSWLEQRLALTVYAYKLGVDTPLLRQLFTGGWLALEWSLIPYHERSPAQLLVRVASLGVHTELARDNVTGIRRVVLYLNAALSVEGSYRLGPFTAVLRSTAMPRYDEQSFGTRVESSLALRIRLVRRSVAHAWFSEITLVPKVTHYYHSYPLLEEVRSTVLTEELQQRVRHYGWSDLRHILTAYCNILFRLRL